MASSMVDDGVRVIRLAVFSIAATVLALGAHVLAGGIPPAFPVTVAAVALPAMAARALVRRRRRVVEISVVLGVVQVALHEVFYAFPATSIAEGPAGHVGHAAHPWMPVTHAVAVLLTGALLAYGERMLGLLLTWWRSLPRRRRARLTVPSLRVHRLVASAPGAPTSIVRWVFAPVVRRGPPARMC